MPATSLEENMNRKSFWTVDMTYEIASIEMSTTTILKLSVWMYSSSWKWNNSEIENVKTQRCLYSLEYIFKSV